MSSLHRLIYTSTRAAHTDDLAIRQILTVSRRNNAQQHITGILVHTTQRFFQYLEGNLEQLLTTYERIAYDRRHYKVQLCDCIPITTRLFPSWQMAYRDLSTRQTILKGSNNKYEEETFRQVLQTSLQSQDYYLRILKKFLLYS